MSGCAIAMLALAVPVADTITVQDLEDADIGAPPGAPVQAEQPLGDPFPTGIPLYWLGAAADNLRFTLEVSGRVQYDSGSGEWSTQFYGFDLYKVFSGDTSDIATMVLQGGSLQSLKETLARMEDPDRALLLRSALKTLAATLEARPEDVLSHQAMLLAQRVFPEVGRIEPRAFRLEGIDPKWRLDAARSAAYEVIGHDGVPLGIVARLDWKLFDNMLDLWCIIKANGTVDSIRRSGGTVDEICLELLDRIAGRQVSELESCTTMAGVVAGKVIRAVGADGDPPP